jgi:hypothetical protein
MEALEKITVSDVPMNKGWKVGYKLIASQALRKAMLLKEGGLREGEK